MKLLISLRSNQSVRLFGRADEAFKADLFQRRTRGTTFVIHLRLETPPMVHLGA